MIQANQPLDQMFNIQDTYGKLADSLISGIGYAAGGLFVLYVVKFGYRHFK